MPRSSTAELPRDWVELLSEFLGFGKRSTHGPACQAMFHWQAGMALSGFEQAVLGLLGEAWQTERSEMDWLRQVVDAAVPLLRPELGIVGAIAKAGRASAADLSITPFARDLPDQLFTVMNDIVAFSRSTPDMRRNFASLAPVMTFSDFSCYADLTRMLAPVGIKDVAVLFTGPVFGTSLAIAANFAERRYFTPREKSALTAAVQQLSVAFNAQQARSAPEAAELAPILQPGQNSVEGRCAELLALGLDTKEIAQAMDISAEAVRKHISNGMKRHGVQTREELVARTMAQGMRLVG